MIESRENLEYRLGALERSVGSLNEQVNTQTTAIQGVTEGSSSKTLPGQHNLVRNGDFDLDRNRYIYDVDFTGAGSVDADVSTEAAHWFTAPNDTAVETTGSIPAGSTALTINAPLFVAGDNGKEIVIEGAGAGGANLVTTINGVPGSTTTAVLANAAVAAVTNVQIRFRLRALLEDSTDVNSDANHATNSALKAPAHSRYAQAGVINDPDYNKADGWARLGSTNWLCAPMPKNYFKPSTTYICTFIYRLAPTYTVAPELAVTPFVGLWDNSIGRRQFLEGKGITVNAAVIGTPAATVSREYYIVFYTGWGEKIGSKVTTVPLAPSNASFVTNSVYVYLSWKQPAGTIRVEIYRKTGTEYKLVGIPVQSDFRDTNGTSGQAQEPQTAVSNYPGVEFNRPKAIIKTTTRNFSPATAEWQLAQLAINVPFDYDASKLTDKQWLVIGLPEAIASGARALEIDRISIDDKFGIFSLCTLDELAKRALSSAPVAGTQGNPGSGGGGGDPLGGIEPGGTNCPTFDMPLQVWKNGEAFRIPAIELVNNIARYKLVNRIGQPVDFTAKVSSVREVIYNCSLDNGTILRASESHPCFTNDLDVTGKPLRDFSFGDTILTIEGETVRVLSNIRQIEKEYVVKIAVCGAEKGFWINGTGGHNRKEDQIGYLQY